MQSLPKHLGVDSSSFYPILKTKIKWEVKQWQRELKGLGVVLPTSKPEEGEGALNMRQGGNKYARPY